MNVFEEVKALVEKDIDNGWAYHELADEISDTGEISAGCLRHWVENHVYTPTLRTLVLVADYYSYEIIMTMRKKK